MRTNTFSLLTMLAAFMLTGFSVLAVDGMTSAPALNMPETDQRIESAATNSYVFKTYLKKDNIKVDSKEGNVTLTGSVSQEDHKSLAGNTVQNLPGVRSVNNQLMVKSEQTENSDAWLTMKVKSALLFHRVVNAFKTDVDVNNGVVTLRGQAATQAQKDLTTEYAKDVKGVKEVRNEMMISPTAGGQDQTLGEEIDDASITAQVKGALASHQSTSALKTDVTTVNGVVTVTGEAANQEEIDLVTQLVKGIRGVKNVENKMTLRANP